MVRRKHKGLILIVLFTAVVTYNSTRSVASLNCLFDKNIVDIQVDKPIMPDDPSSVVNRLNRSFQTFMINGDTAGARACMNNIIKNIGINKIDSAILSDSYYYTGVYYLVTGKYSTGIKWLKLSATIRENLKKSDEIYSKCLNNLGVAYNFLGNFNEMERYFVMSLEIEKRLYGEMSPLLLAGLSNLVTASLELKEYEKSITYGNTALNLIGNREDEFLMSDVADLYLNIGVCHTRLADYSKARLYLEKSEALYLLGSIDKDESYVNLLNNLAIVYGALGLNDKSGEYYEMGIQMSELYNSARTFNLINSYAILLGNSGRTDKGKALLANSVEKAKKIYGSDSRDYIAVLKDYAEYLIIFKIDKEKSLILYKQCFDYVNINREDLSLKDPVLLGYAVALSENGEPAKALEIVQELLYPDFAEKSNFDITDNPEIEKIPPDRKSLSVLRAKYKILWEIYKENGEFDILKAIGNTSEVIISVLEKVRINISEEESRLVLGDRYRDSYLFAIRDFDLCYRKTNDLSFLEKAFKYAEKSKVAGLLSSTRELRASQFHIPSNLAELEKSLQKEISFNNALLAEENNKKKPDLSLVSEWSGNLLRFTQKRDSLIDLFERKYPDYYLIKYNTQVAKLRDIPGIIGRQSNYFNYVVSDTVLYLFVVNRKHQQLLSISIDSTFYNKIRDFRNLLSMPSPLNNARTEFMQFQELGTDLYKTLVEPARRYMISDQILISPDNILSYLPFETLPTMAVSGKDIVYQELSYMMRDFKISYTYSVTLMAESSRKEFSLANSLIAFAPVYTERINIDSLLYSRQGKLNILYDLPYARQEAEYVADLSGGKIYINNEAIESVFKSESGQFDIIHLAMHTVLNDRFPMHSKMIFYLGRDSAEDNLLNTYEVYGIPLKAKMVVLSSCNTGTGILHSGEGILSLARGFIYSGSQSVIMSMWEIEDKSGMEIVKKFYQNLKKGNTKSDALRKARLDYLKKADQLKSHPYFWSSLVVYGNNAPLYYSRHLFIMILAGISFIFFSLLFYSRKPK
ncbi:MAG TPA: CHAT domain-containing tetratricopeptide repeat protein [Bacteroidales bacterium]|nr:CHAT domain-containing tetratricopeptide repeat protein [Bacteroidales bacterium]